MTITCHECSRTLTAAEIVERWCLKCQRETKTEQKRAA